jgi:hypothetical protein
MLEADPRLLEANLEPQIVTCSRTYQMEAAYLSTLLPAHMEHVIAQKGISQHGKKLFEKWSTFCTK